MRAIKFNYFVFCHSTISEKNLTIGDEGEIRAVVSHCKYRLADQVGQSPVETY